MKTSEHNAFIDTLTHTKHVLLFQKYSPLYHSKNILDYSLIPISWGFYAKILTP